MRRLPVTGNLPFLTKQAARNGHGARVLQRLENPVAVTRKRPFAGARKGRRGKGAYVMKQTHVEIGCTQ